MPNSFPSPYPAPHPNFIYPSYPEGRTSYICCTCHSSGVMGLYPKVPEGGAVYRVSSKAEKGDGNPDFLFRTRKCSADEVSGSCRLSSLPSVLNLSLAVRDAHSGGWVVE